MNDIARRGQFWRRSMTAVIVAVGLWLKRYARRSVTRPASLPQRRPMSPRIRRPLPRCLSSMWSQLRRTSTPDA